MVLHFLGGSNLCTPSPTRCTRIGRANWAKGELCVTFFTYIRQADPPIASAPLLLLLQDAAFLKISSLELQPEVHKGTWGWGWGSGLPSSSHLARSQGLTVLSTHKGIYGLSIFHCNHFLTASGSLLYFPNSSLYSFLLADNIQL